MLNAFDPEDLLNLEAFFNPLSINEPIAKKSAATKLSRLNSNLDLSNHPARSILHFSKNHAFKMLAGFRYAVAGNKNPRLLHSLVQILDYDIGSYAKIE